MQGQGCVCYFLKKKRGLFASPKKKKNLGTPGFIFQKRKTSK
jgi:hypothetical protein